jgi:hypothetical protein
MSVATPRSLSPTRERDPPRLIVIGAAQRGGSQRANCSRGRRSRVSQEITT